MDLISEDKLRVIAGKQNKDLIMVEKDYFLTLFLYLIKEKEGLYFKGGTALNKIFLNHIRLSEDLDFTITRPLDVIKEIIQGIIQENKGLFTKLQYDKSVFDFTRYLINYKSYFKKDSTLIIDLNKRAKLSLKPEENIIPNFYDLDFKVNTLNKKEMITEKVLALINRNRPRDYFDVYQLIKKRIPIDIKLVKEKSKAQQQEFNIIKIFNKANKIHTNWEKDLSPLTRDRTSFHKVMETLAKYFKLKEEKERIRKLKSATKKS